MTHTTLTRTDGKKQYAFLVANGVVLVRRLDLRTSKWSSGNVTPADRAWALTAAQSMGA